MKNSFCFCLQSNRKNDAKCHPKIGSIPFDSDVFCRKFSMMRKTNLRSLFKNNIITSAPIGAESIFLENFNTTNFPLDEPKMM